MRMAILPTPSYTGSNGSHFNNKSVISILTDPNMTSTWDNNTFKRFDFVVDTVIIGTVCLLGLMGNILSFCVFSKHKNETPTVFLLRVLSLTDSLLLLTSIFMYSINGIHTFKAFQENFLYIQLYVWPLALMAHTATVWLTVIISIHRYTLVCKPVGLLRSLMSKISKAQVAAVLSFSILYNIPRFFEHQKMYSQELKGNLTNTTSAPHTLGANQVYQIVYSNLLYFPIMYIIPLCLLAYFNSKLIKAVQALQERKETLTGHSHRSREDNCNVTTIVIVIVCIFIVCQTPALINQIFWATFGESQRKPGGFHFYYTRVSDLLVVLNSSVNFVIYCLFGRTFRRLFIDCLCGFRSNSASHANRHSRH